MRPPYDKEWPQGLNSGLDLLTHLSARGTDKATDLALLPRGALE
jgi:hypothetical protein